jgi:hypothetical protein
MMRLSPLRTVHQSPPSTADEGPGASRLLPSREEAPGFYSTARATIDCAVVRALGMALGLTMLANGGGLALWWVLR